MERKNCTSRTQLHQTYVSSDITLFFRGQRPLPFGGSQLDEYRQLIEPYPWTSGDSIHHRQSVCACQGQRYTNWATPRLYQLTSLNDRRSRMHAKSIFPLTLYVCLCLGWNSGKVWFSPTYSFVPFSSGRISHGSHIPRPIHKTEKTSCIQFVHKEKNLTVTVRLPSYLLSEVCRRIRSLPAVYHSVSVSDSADPLIQECRAASLSSLWRPEGVHSQASHPNTQELLSNSLRQNFRFKAASLLRAYTRVTSSGSSIPAIGPSPRWLISTASIDVTRSARSVQRMLACPINKEAKFHQDTLWFHERLNEQATQASSPVRSLNYATREHMSCGQALADNNLCTSSPLLLSHLWCQSAVFSDRPPWIPGVCQRGDAVCPGGSAVTSYGPSRNYSRLSQSCSPHLLIHRTVIRRLHAGESFLHGKTKPLNQSMNSFVVGAHCLSAGRSLYATNLLYWVLPVDQQGFDPPPAVCLHAIQVVQDTKQKLRKITSTPQEDNRSLPPAQRTHRWLFKRILCSHSPEMF